VIVAYARVSAFLPNSCRVDKGVNMTLYLRAAAALRSLYKSPPLVGAPTPALEAPQQLPMLSSSVGYANEDGHSFSGGGGRSYAGDERGAGRGGQGRGGRGEPKRRRRNDEEVRWVCIVQMRVFCTLLCQSRLVLIIGTDTQGV